MPQPSSVCSLGELRRRRKAAQRTAERRARDLRHGHSTGIEVVEVLVSQPPRARSTFEQETHAHYATQALYKADCLEALTDMLLEAARVGLQSIEVRYRLAGETGRRSPLWSLSYA